MQKKLSVIVLSAVLLAFFVVPNITHAAGEKVKVVSYNIQGGCTGPMDEGSYNLSTQIEVLKNIDADVVLLQEAQASYTKKGSCTASHSKSQPAQIASALGMKYVRHGTLGILSKFEMGPTNKGNFPNSSRKYIRTRMKMENNVTFFVYNAHLERFNKSTRKKQLKKLGEMVEAEDEPVIVGGDFNECATDVKSSYFSNFSESVGSSPTFPTQAPTKQSTISKLVSSSGCGISASNMNERLDYLFGDSGSWGAQAGGVITAAGTASDHFPIYTDFVLTKKTAGTGPKPKPNTNPAADASLIGDLSRGFVGGKLSQAEIEKLLQTPTPKIKIPGLNFSAQQIHTDERGGTFLSVPFLGEYIGAIYRYAIIFISVLSVIILIIAGIQWTLAGSGSAKEKIKLRIAGSLLGLIIAVSSYSILYLVNPELVNFSNLQVQLIKPLEENELIALFAKSEGFSVDADGKITKSASYKYDGPKADIVGANCKTEPSKHSGIGTTKYLGQLDCQAKSKRKSLDAIKYVILHEGGFTTKGTVSFWQRRCKNTGKCYGTHYMIQRNGTIDQITDEIRRISHTPGGWNNASIGIDLAIRGGLAYGSATKCIKAKRNGFYYKKVKNKSGKTTYKKVKEGKADTAQQAVNDCLQAYTPAQYASLNKLLKSIESRTGVTLDGTHVRAHCNASGNHADPRGFDWRKINIKEKDSPKCHFNPAYFDKHTKYAEKLFKSVPICCVDPTDPNAPNIPTTATECSQSGGVQVPASQCGL